MDHDRLHKLLLETFFEPFLAAFVPGLAAELTPGSLVSVSQEVLAEALGQGDRRADLLMRGEVLGREVFLLVHVEVQAQPDAGLPERMFQYYTRLLVKHGLSVHPVAVLTYGSRQAHDGTFVVVSGGREVVRFRYYVVQLKRLPWRSYKGLENPITTALMLQMAGAARERERVRWESWRQLVRLWRGLSGREQAILQGYVSAYAPLSAEAQLQLVRESKRELGVTHEAYDDLSWLPKLPAVTPEVYAAWLNQQSREDALAEGVQKGRHESALRLCRRVLEAKLGALSAATLAQIEAQPVDRLEDLVAAVFGLADEAAVRAWLAG
jgi:hypothetical protein